MLDEKIYWAWFLSVPGIGRKTFSQLLHFAKQLNVSLAEIYQHPYILAQVNFSTSKLESITDFKKQFSPDQYQHYLTKQDIYLISSTDATYPKLLSQIYDPPLILFCKGKNLFVSKQIEQTIAVVGTRRVTSYGKLVTEKIVAELVGEKMMIISGGMYGVDILAHQTAISHQGSTIAVLGYGFEHCYPKRSQSFFEDFLAKGGMLISEFAPFVQPIAGNFPTRNRIVAGLAQGVLVTEAAEKSGSHITAQFALDEGRMVYSVPGPITNPYCAGTKWLINQGATFVSSGQEIVSDLQLEKLNLGPSNYLKPENPIQQQIYDHLSSQAQTMDELALALQMDISDLSVELAMMEVNGVVAKMGEIWQIL